MVVTGKPVALNPDANSVITRRFGLYYDSGHLSPFGRNQNGGCCLSALITLTVKAYFYRYIPVITQFNSDGMWLSGKNTAVGQLSMEQ